MQTQFDIFVAKHGEHGAQAIVEMWERYVGIRRTEAMPLEHRWAIFMQTSSLAPMAA